MDALWSALTAAGGSLGLAFIIVLAFALVALALVFGGSAVVVLDRFARMARRPLPVANPKRERATPKGDPIRSNSRLFDRKSRSHIPATSAWSFSTIRSVAFHAFW